jgi:hypothetical protein
MAYLFSQWTPKVQIENFRFDWSIYTLFELNRVWIHDFLQIMIFVHVSSTSGIVELNAFWDENNKKGRKWCKFVSTILLNNPHGLPVIIMDRKSPNQVFYVWFVDLQAIRAKYGLETWFYANKDIRISLLNMKRRWT